MSYLDPKTDELLIEDVLTIIEYYHGRPSITDVVNELRHSRWNSNNVIRRKWKNIRKVELEDGLEELGFTLERIRTPDHCVRATYVTI